MKRHGVKKALMAFGGAIFVAAAALPGTASSQHFGYLGSIGPDYWGQLSAEWTTCGKGNIQSPVKISHFNQHAKFSHYKHFNPKTVALEYSKSTGRIFNNGHTIEVEVDGGWNTLTLNGKRYTLAQYHFHTPSEHRVGKAVEEGRGYDMELHLVHTAADGTNAVIGVFLARGHSSGALAPILSLLPDLETPDPAIKLEVPTFNPAAFLPRSGRHARYVGSLTTPPCTEGVQWIVFEEPMTVSDEDLANLAELIRFNARLVQRHL